MREDMNEWMVWKCYPSGVEVLAYEGGVYVIFDHESIKRNSKRSQNLTKLKMIQESCKRGCFFVGFMHSVQLIFSKN